jgi:outer membrane immunogenic protein
MRIPFMVLAGCVLAATTFGPAKAADMATKAPPPMITAPAMSWTGFYVGGNFGYGWSDPTATFAPNPAPSGGGLVGLIGAGAPVSFDMSGAVGGIQLGYNWQVNQHWLVGVETDFDFSGLRGDGSSQNNTSINFPFSSTANENIDWFGTVRARLGFLPTNNLLVYGTGGYAHGSVKQNVTYVNNGGNTVADQDGNCAVGPGACYTGSSSRLANGWAAGGGLEYAFAEHWSVRAEYLYIDLGDNTLTESVPSSNTPGIPASAITAHYTATTLQTIRGGLNYRF